MADEPGVLTISSMPKYMAPPEARVSDDVRSFTPIPTPIYNENPHTPIDLTGYSELSDPIRDLDFDPGRTRRGYIVTSFNPYQWQMGSDLFVSGKVETGKQSATAYIGGMAPAGQRANIPTVQVSSYGDLLTASTDGVGVDPYSGW